MNRYSLRFLPLLLLFSFSLTAIFAFADNDAAAAEKSHVAVLNIQEIMRQSKAAQSVRKQLESKQKQFQKEMSAKEEELQKEDQELAKQRSLLSAEAFQEKVKAFRSKATNVQKEVRSKKASLDKAFGQALGDIQKAVHDIVKAIAKERGVDIVIPTSQLLYASPELDISQDVLKRLDQKLPDIKLDFSAPGGA